MPAGGDGRSAAERDAASCKRLCSELKLYKSTVIGGSQQDGAMVESACGAAQAQSLPHRHTALAAVMDACQSAAGAHRLMLAESTALQQSHASEGAKRCRSVADAWSAKWRHLEGTEAEVAKCHGRLATAEHKAAAQPHKVTQARRSLSAAAERANIERSSLAADWQRYNDSLRTEHMTTLVANAARLQALESRGTYLNAERAWRGVESAAATAASQQQQQQAGEQQPGPPLADVFSAQDAKYALALRQHLDRACALSIVGGGGK